MAADPTDTLYETLPAEFVKARNAMVKALKAAGQREPADRAAKLPRPTASVWVTNQIARHAPQLVERLAEATARLQGGVSRDRERYAGTINTHRELLNEVRAKVEETLRAAGLRVAPPVVAAAVQNFRTGLMNGATRPLLAAGRLEHDVPLDADDGLFGLAAMAAAGDAEAPARVHHASPRPAHDRQPAAGDKARERERERERRDHERALAKARAETERRVHALRRTADAAQAARARHEAAVASARRELERAERALADAVTAEAEARAALAAAEADLERPSRHPGAD